MKQRICIGLQALTLEWQMVLDDIGLSYEQIDYSKLTAAEYSVLILNEKPDVKQLPQLYTYLKESGSVLEVSDVHIFHPSSEIRRIYRSTIVNNSSDAKFKHIQYLDVFNRVHSHQKSKILDGIVHFTNVEQGVSAFIGLDIPKLIDQNGYRRKRFFNPTGIFPDEIVSDVSKHKIIQVFEEVLKELHFKRKLPFVKKWISPTKKPVFGFRVDSDYGDRASVEALYSLADKYKLRLSWFLHVEAHKEWLKYFTELEHQEIALHGYKHGTTSSKKKIISNIGVGLEKLGDAGIHTKGYCAPYGIWNKSLMKTLSSFKFLYSSEFTFAYDTIPLHPHQDDLPLQIPIHPVCTGSLNRKGLNLAEMKTYFEFVFNNKLARFEPVFFYHHPMQVGLECVEYIFKRTIAEGLSNLTFSEYAHFWKRRKKLKLDIYTENNSIQFNSTDVDHQWIQVFSNSNSFHLYPANSQVFELSKSPEFEYSKQYLPEPAQVMNMRKRSLKSLKTSFLDWKNREKL